MTENNASAGFQKIIDLDALRAVSVRSDSVDLGHIRQGEMLEYRLGIRNADSIPFILLEVMSTCGCTALHYDKKPIHPGDTASLVLHYDSKGQIGSQLKQIQISTSLASKPYSILLSAEVSQ